MVMPAACESVAALARMRKLGAVLRPIAIISIEGTMIDGCGASRNRAKSEETLVEARSDTVCVCVCVSVCACVCVCVVLWVFVCV